ncbi:MAG: lactate utilization protein [Chloroflexota bacterium]|nr:lactate utilization protein [Chloroflexota bacterium]MDE2948821.1 lactate utilization protein [Chloroflexota bacterium]
MSARERILSRLRAAQAPFTDVALIVERRQMIPPQTMTASERLNQFIDNAQSLGCFVYQVDRSEAVEQIMDLLDGDKSLLSWDEAHLPLDGAHGLLNSLGVAVAQHNDGGVRVGLTGVNAALAATGSLVLESGAGRYRSASLLPDLHIALMTADQVLPDLETWAAARAHEAFREASNTVIVSGPSKTADIGHQLVKGAHGPRELHILILP